jgi:hypothetical protein
VLKGASELRARLEIKYYCVFKSRRLRKIGCTERLREMRNKQKLLFGKPERKSKLERHKRKSRNNIKMDHRAWICGQDSSCSGWSIKVCLYKQATEVRFMK